MKKKWITVLATLFTCATLALGFTACGSGNNSESSDNMNTEQGTSEISFKTLSVDGTNVYGKVSNATEEFSFIDEITAVGTAKFVVSLDVYGAQQVATKVIPLEIGDNTVYITEMVDSEPVNVYTVTVRRRPIYEVTIADGTDTTMQKIEEDGFVSEPAQPTKIGYTFTTWDYDFSKPITKNTTVKAGWIENAEMSKFNFTSTATTCCIRGIKDKTLTEIIIPDCVTSVGTYAFYDCINLTSVVIGNGVTSIDSGAFYGCGNLVSIEISDSVTSIGYEAFYGCSSLTSVYITDMAAWCNISFENSMALGSSAANPLFYAEDLYLKNELVTELVIPNSVTSIGDYAFSDYSGLTSVTICNGVTSIGDYAFDSCRNLTTVEISDSVTSIGSSAFYNCSSLMSVVIGDSVTNIGNVAFFECYKLIELVNKSTFITVEKGKTSNGHAGYYALAVYNSSDTFTGTKISNDNGYMVYTEGEEKILFGYTGTETDLVLPLYITKIYQYAFENCKNLMSVIIPDSITSIGEFAFDSCSSLTSVVIPDSITSIGKSAFKGCSNLAEITLPFVGASKSAKSASRLFGYIFGTSSYTGAVAAEQYYDSLSSITYYIPTSLKKVTITGGSIGDYVFYNCSSLTSVVIGDSVTSIGDCAFQFCSGLTCLEIGAGVTGIGGYAFSDCGSLTSVVISDNVMSIGRFAFYNCSGLTSVVIGDEVTNIDIGVFAFCSSLTSIEIPDSIMSIGSYAFDGCTDLTSVYITDIEAWCNISFGDYSANPLYYAKNLYLNNDLVTELEIPDSVTSIGDYAFYNCSSLTSVVIPDSVTNIGNMFRGCINLMSIEIPDSVTSIVRLAFLGCDNLTIYCEAASKPSGWDLDWNYSNRPVVWGYKE